VPAKTLSNEALDAIALHCSANLLTRDRQTEARQPLATLPGQYGERLTAGFLRLLEDAFVVSCGQEAHAPLEVQSRRRIDQLAQTGTLRGKAGSTFGAPGFDHFTARLCRHAGAKAVAPLTLQSAWLKWSFHCAAPVTRAREALTVRVSQKGLNANVTFHHLSNVCDVFNRYGLDPVTVIHSQPLLNLSKTSP